MNISKKEENHRIVKEEFQINSRIIGRLKIFTGTHDLRQINMWLLDNNWRDYYVADKNDDPETFEDAMECIDPEKWKEHIALEFTQIEEHATWISTELPKDWNALSTKFVFKRRLHVVGYLALYKVRLAVHGFIQKFWLDYGDKYAPVVEYFTIWSSWYTCSSSWLCFCISQRRH